MSRLSASLKKWWLKLVEFLKEWWMEIFLIVFLCTIPLILMSICYYHETTTYVYKYETLDGEKGVAPFCREASKNSPSEYCELSDGTVVYGIKQWKKVVRDK